MSFQASKAPLILAAATSTSNVIMVIHNQLGNETARELKCKTIISANILPPFTYYLHYTTSKPICQALLLLKSYRLYPL